MSSGLFSRRSGGDAGSFGSPAPNRLDGREPMLGEVFEAFDHLESAAA
jgi:hypothetical protein